MEKKLYNRHLEANKPHIEGNPLSNNLANIHTEISEQYAEEKTKELQEKIKTLQFEEAFNANTISTLQSRLDVATKALEIAMSSFIKNIFQLTNH